MAFILPLHDENRSIRKPILTYLIIAINVIIFVFISIMGNKSKYFIFFEYGAVPAYLLRGTRLWTLITSMFLHQDIFHLAGNMLFLWVFSDNIEDTLGKTKYLSFYLLGGIFASFTHIFSSLISNFFSVSQFIFPSLQIPSIGASGAISAVLGAYLILYPKARVRTLVLLGYFVTFTYIPAIFYLGFWFLYQLLMGFASIFLSSSSIAFWAHIGGFIFGIIAIKTLDIKPKYPPDQKLVKKSVSPIIGPIRIKPLVDYIKDEDKITILAMLPGIERKKIKIDASRMNVTISADFRDIKFYNKIDLPVSVVPNPKNIIYRNGVLSFTLDIET